MGLFDAYVTCDWSASSQPKRGADSIWICAVTWTGDEATVCALENAATRRAAAAYVNELVRGLTARGLRVLAGFDFPYGYPSGLAAALGANGDSRPWRATWTRLARGIQDGVRNENNRFEVASDWNSKLGPSPGPFWGCPARQQTGALRSTGCAFPYPAGGSNLERLRIAERRLHGVQESWKLFGNGSVGSQALLGIPYVTSLRDDERLAPVSLVWPFETGFTERPAPDDGPWIVHAEIWPGVVPIDRTQHPVRDAAQVLTLARHFAALDKRETLGELFKEPTGLTARELAACIAEEGWILGA